MCKTCKPKSTKIIPITRPTKEFPEIRKIPQEAIKSKVENKIILFLAILLLSFSATVAAKAPTIPNKPNSPVAPLPKPKLSFIKKKGGPKALNPPKAKAPRKVANRNEGSVLK